MKTLYRQFIVTTFLILLVSTIIAFFLTNTYYYLVSVKLNDERNVAIAQEITQYIEKTDPIDLEHYLSTLGKIGFQIYVVGESGYSRIIGGEFAGKD